MGSTPSTPEVLRSSGDADERRKHRRCRTSSWRIDGTENGWALLTGAISISAL